MTHRPPSRGRARILTVLTGGLLCGVVAAGCSSALSTPDPGAARRPITPTDGEAAVATLTQAGLAQLAHGQLDSAQETFATVVALDPGNLYAHYDLGLIAQRAGDGATARAEYDAAIAADSDFTPALYNRAILEESTDLPAAVLLYRRAAEADPTFAAAYMRLGFALVHLGEDAAGAEALGTGVHLNPAMATVDAPTY